MLMTGEHLDAILKLAGAKSEKDGWLSLPDASTLTLHVAHDGASMTISRIDGLRQEGELVFARSFSSSSVAMCSRWRSKPIQWQARSCVEPVSADTREGCAGSTASPH
jgi:hypothetical protein